MKIAIVQDWLTNMGGGEQVVLALHEMYPDAPIYTALYNPNAPLRSGSTASFVRDPVSGEVSQFNIDRYSNPDLKPETSKQFNVGVVFEPARNWNGSIDFWQIRKSDIISEIGEVTTLFKDTDPEEAIDLATAGKVISVASNSNYGNALAKFSRGWLGSISRRTTVLVIGDGRNNYNPANVWALEDLKRKAKRVVWICTEPRSSWGFGDSEMQNYSRACHQVVTVQTLADLEQVAAQLVPT